MTSSDLQEIFSCTILLTVDDTSWCCALQVMDGLFFPTGS